MACRMDILDLLMMFYVTSYTRTKVDGEGYFVGL